MNKIHTWLNRWFGNAEEINGGGICPTYLYRWVLCKLPRGYKAYLHHFVGDDWSLDYHDHPKRFISIGLWGSYVERTPLTDAEEAACKAELDASLKRLEARAKESGMDAEVTFTGEVEMWDEQTYQAPWIRSFPAEWKHRIRTPSGSCWTLVIVGAPSRDWGFWHQGQFIGWKRYVRGEDTREIRESRKACD